MHFALLVLLACLTFGLSKDSSEDNWELDLVQVVIRNGISTPDELYPHDANNPDDWEEGLGQLTLVGQKQLYAIGKVLKKRYRNFLTTNPVEVKVSSTYNDKCMSSALCLLASLYEPTPDWEFLPGFNWQPIPVHYEPPHADTILKQYANFEAMEISRPPEFYEELPNYKKQLTYWTANSGMPVKNQFQASALYKILSAELMSNRTIPKWAWTYWDDLKNFNDHSYAAVFSEPSVIKLVGGPLLSRMLKNAKYRIQGKYPEIKSYIYSGQSYHLAGVLGALKLPGNKEPPIGATFLMDLYRKPNQLNATNFDYAVQISYLNRTEDYLKLGKPTTLVIPGCHRLCPFELLKFNKR